MILSLFVCWVGAASLGEWLGWCPRGREGEAIVRSPAGIFEGLVECRHRSFLGIKYGEARRWSLPQLYTHQKLYSAQRWGNYCPQLLSEQERHPVMNLFFGLPTGDNSEESEDCLNLNVFTPRAMTKLVPVLVFIHGGMFSKGASSMPLYHPHRLVSSRLGDDSVVVVTLNYRMGLFGFLGGHQWAKEVGNGNWALHDMQVALEWVQQNIEAFGGDPKQVTLMGQSAGAMAAHWLTTRMDTTGLFQRVILMGGSDSLLPSRHLRPEGVASRSLQIILDHFDCHDVECLRHIPWPELQAVAIQRGWEYNWAPLIVEGRYRKSNALIPILFTTVKDEGSLFACMQQLKGMSLADSLQEIMFDQPHLIERCLALYDTEESEFSLVNTMITDAQFHCPLDTVDQSMPMNAPIYYDQIDQPFSLASAFTTHLMDVDFGTFHGSDVMMFFRSIPLVIYPHARDIDVLQEKILHFIKTGNYPWTKARGQWMPVEVKIKCQLIWNQLPAGAIPPDWNADMTPVI